MRIVKPSFCASALCLAALFTVPLHAQLFEMNHGNHAGVPMSPQQEATVKRLDSLNTLPTDKWRYHVGDVPHGEDPSLNDASWQEVEVHSERAQRFMAPKEGVWFRREIEGRVEPFLEQWKASESKRNRTVAGSMFSAVPATSSRESGPQKILHGSSTSAEKRSSWICISDFLTAWYSYKISVFKRLAQDSQRGLAFYPPSAV